MCVCHGYVFQTPGPGTYNTTEPSLYKDKSPHYSMTSRNVMPGDTTQKPGPGAHSPENVRTVACDFILSFDALIPESFEDATEILLFEFYLVLGVILNGVFKRFSFCRFG